MVAGGVYPGTYDIYIGKFGRLKWVKMGNNRDLYNNDVIMRNNDVIMEASICITCINALIIT